MSVVLRNAQVKHFVEVAQPDMIVSIRFDAQFQKLLSLQETLKPKVKCSAALLNRLSTCDLDWGVINTYIDIGAPVMDDDSVFTVGNSAQQQAANDDVDHKLMPLDGSVLSRLTSKPLG